MTAPDPFAPKTTAPFAPVQFAPGHDVAVTGTIPATADRDEIWTRVVVGIGAWNLGIDQVYDHARHLITKAMNVPDDDADDIMWTVQAYDTAEGLLKPVQSPTAAAGTFAPVPCEPGYAVGLTGVAPDGRDMILVVSDKLWNTDSEEVYRICRGSVLRALDLTEGDAVTWFSGAVPWAVVPAVREYEADR